MPSPVVISKTIRNAGGALAVLVVALTPSGCGDSGRPKDRPATLQDRYEAFGEPLREELRPRFEEALESLRQNRRTKARTEFRELSREQPGNVDIRFYLGLSFRGRRMRSESLEAFTGLAREFPGSPLGPVGLALVATDDGLVDEARAHLETARATGQSHAWLDHVEGLTAMLAGDDDAALEAFRRAADADPMLADAWTNQGLLLARRGSLDEAEAVLRGALEAQPWDLGALNQLALVLARAGRHDEASAVRSRHERLSLVADLSLAPPGTTPVAHRRLAEHYLRAGRPESALRELDALVELEPDDVAIRDQADKLRSVLAKRDPRRATDSAAPGDSRVPGDSRPAGVREPTDAAVPTAIRLVDVTARAGIRFRHENGKTPTRYLVETMGAAAALADLDGDGALDVYLVNSCPIPIPADGGPGNAYYRNRGDGTFEDRTEESGLRGGGYGQGVAAADVDGDGDTDLYVTLAGPNQLFRNEGDGTFVEVGAAASVDDPGWGVSAAFLDADRDGALDLYVCNYLEFDFEKYESYVREGETTYPHPDLFAAQPDTFFLGRGDGTFQKATRRVGLFDAGGKALGVVAGDFDDDDDTDVYVANDSTPNLLFRNRGDGTFEEVATLLGVAFSAGGASEAGMGVDAGDVDGDLLLDLVTTNFNGEGTTVYRARPDGWYDDASIASGIARYTLPYLGFGMGLADLDVDGDLDLVQTNGHVLDNIDRFFPGMQQAQRCQVFENVGSGRFREVTEDAGEELLRPIVGRALSFGDVDGDGDLDLLLFANGGEAYLYRNDSAPRHAPLVMELRGVTSSREPIGARVVLTAGERRTRRDVLGGRSYISASETKLHFAVPPGTEDAIATIHWPSGEAETVGDLRANERVVVVEGRGVVAREPLAEPSGE